MEIDVNILSDNWSIAGVVASFLVAGIALWLGIRSSRQLYKMRRVEKRESGIKEIIAWATDVIDFTAGQTTFSAKDLVEIFKSGIPFETVTKTSAHDRHVKLNKLSSKAVYIDSLRELLFSNSTDLNLAIHKVRRKIYEHLCFLTLEMNGRVKNTEKSTQLHLRRLLDESISLVKIATDLYTKIK